MKHKGKNKLTKAQIAEKLGMPILAISTQMQHLFNEELRYKEDADTGKKNLEEAKK